jgi:hypothetical protein
MSVVYRVSHRDGFVFVVDSVEAIEQALQAAIPSVYRIDEIETPSGRHLRRWGFAAKHPDGTVMLKPEQRRD